MQGGASESLRYVLSCSELTGNMNAGFCCRECDETPSTHSRQEGPMIVDQSQAGEGLPDFDVVTCVPVITRVMLYRTL